MGDADRRVGPVHVLTAGAARAVGIHAQVGRVDGDIDVVVDLGIDEYRGKRGVPAVAGVEWRLAHQAMNPGFGAQPAVGMGSGETHRDTFDARHFAFGDFQNFGLEAAAVAPHEVHAQQHVGPVLCLGAAGTSLDVHETVMCIHLAREHALEFEVGHLLASRLDILLHGDADFGVVLRARKFEQFTGVSQPAAEFFQRAEFIFQARAFAPKLLCLLRVIPDIGFFELRAN